MKWVEVQIKTCSENVEIISAILYDLDVGGLSIEDPNDIAIKAQNMDSWEYIDTEELLEGQDDSVLIKAYFPEDVDILGNIEAIRQRVEIVPKYETGESLGEVSLSEVFEKDWANSWKKYYKTTKIGEKIVIKPSWEEYRAEDGELVVELDPGMAFGTGTHETTELCVRELEKVVHEGSTVLDVGCGSGILSIVAAKLGARNVVGVDIDEMAVRVSNENTAINGVEGLVDIRHGDLLDVVSDKYDIVVANILAEVIAILNKDIKRCLGPDSLFICSGIIYNKIDFVKDSLAENGLAVVDVIELGEWAVIVSRLGEGK